MGLSPNKNQTAEKEKSDSDSGDESDIESTFSLCDEDGTDIALAEIGSSSEEDNKAGNDVEMSSVVCKSEDVMYIVYPYEADAQMAYLVKNGDADFVVTEYSDLLTYGCKQVMAKVNMNGDGELFLLDKVLDCLHLTIPQFQNMCIAAGCDYLKNVKGFGINKAYKAIKMYGSDFLQFIPNAPAEYIDSFNKVFAVFNHQTVFDINTCQTVPLQETTTELSLEVQYLCGNDCGETEIVGEINSRNRGIELPGLGQLNIFPNPDECVITQALDNVNGCVEEAVEVLLGDDTDYKIEIL
ncbi:exonuclease 1-like [Dendronephthya gigantea]|uniref:exonuclease 1-like n=1 Tax=Dendronephthya gigantea TaxID=151771 RepID=UPI00106B916C|nr:exonuclease 1-like [Dendronephthya gigantea]